MLESAAWNGSYTESGTLATEPPPALKIAARWLTMPQFLSQTTACGVEPGSHVWINDVLAMSARRPRKDRLVHEAEATGGDPRCICDLFGLSVGAALRYTSTVDEPGLVE